VRSIQPNVFDLCITQTTAAQHALQLAACPEVRTLSWARPLWNLLASRSPCRDVLLCTLPKSCRHVVLLRNTHSFDWMPLIYLTRTILFACRHGQIEGRCVLALLCNRSYKLTREQLSCIAINGLFARSANSWLVGASVSERVNVGTRDAVKGHQRHIEHLPDS